MIQKNQATDQLIALGVTNIEKDRVIWKAYSEQGGLFDLFKSFNLAVTRPTANAMDYDEDENTYVICITLHNAIYLRIKRNLERLYQSLNKAEQLGKEYVPAVRELSTTKKEHLNTPEIYRPEGRLIKFLKVVDNWLMRFHLYKKIRCTIIHDSENTTKKDSVQVTETVEIYEKDELIKASYQMHHSELLQTIVQIVNEMEKQLAPLHEKNESSLNDYLGRAEVINAMMETKLLCYKDWVL